MSDIKLYGYATSPFVRKTACFLYFKELDFQHVPVNPVDPASTIGHTKGTQVPVLEIDGEWRRESSSHALWLDELFPGKPLCPTEHREKILYIDDWLNKAFFPSIFRSAVDGEMTLEKRHRFWRLAALISAHTPLSEETRNKWPDFVRQVPFIRAMAENMDLSESHRDMQIRIGSTLVEHIGQGPFFGGLVQPTMLDMAVFPQLVFGYMFGLESQISAAAHPVIKDWMLKVSQFLPDNPTLVADHMKVNDLKAALA